MESIIKLAIEGGWKENLESDDWHCRRDYMIRLSVLDPLFWQALGKACGWKEVLSHGSIQGGDEEGCTRDECQGWYRNALRFHEINLTEGWDPAIIYLRSMCGLTK